MVSRAGRRAGTSVTKRVLGQQVPAGMLAPVGHRLREVDMLEEVSRRRLFGWLAAAIAVTVPALVASEPAEADRLSAWSVGNHHGKDAA